MLNFLKKIFAKEAIIDHKISIEGLNAWLEQKSKPFFESLDADIRQIIEKIKEEKQAAKENLNVLENAELQNPNIPLRAKMIARGNREAFIHKVSYLFESISFDYANYNELMAKCNKLIEDIDNLGKSTAKSYHILNEFFAREVEKAAANIKNLENSLREIASAAGNSKIKGIENIKASISELKNKISLKERLISEIENNKKLLEETKNKIANNENKVTELKSGFAYPKYEKLLAERQNTESRINKIETSIFHDFSAIEKALKKYAKIGLENESFISEYLASPIEALLKDNDLRVADLLEKLKISMPTMDLEEKRKDKIMAKLEELDSIYLAKARDDLISAKSLLEKINSGIMGDDARRNHESLKKEMENLEQNAESLNNRINEIANELEKISIGELKENIQKSIYETIGMKVVIDYSK